VNSSFSSGLPFALYSVWLTAVVKLSFLSRCILRVALLFGPLASRMVASTAFSKVVGQTL
jgi:hypothetical protein